MLILRTKEFGCCKVLIKAKHIDVFNRVMQANTNGEDFQIKIVEEWHGYSG